MLLSRMFELVTAGLLVALNAMTFRYRLWAVVSHVYSTYTMLPSPLMSPYILRTVALDPLAMPVGGMMPVAKPPSGVSVAPEAWALVKHAVIVGGVADALNAATRNDS